MHSGAMSLRECRNLGIADQVTVRRSVGGQHCRHLSHVIFPWQ